MSPLSIAKVAADFFTGGMLPQVDVSEVSIHELENVDAPSTLITGMPFIYDKGTNTWKARFWSVSIPTSVTAAVLLDSIYYKSMSIDPSILSTGTIISTIVLQGTHLIATPIIEGTCSIETTVLQGTHLIANPIVEGTYSIETIVLQGTHLIANPVTEATCSIETIVVKGG